ncbi:MAG: acetoacetate--CoA ligase [Lewinellaceae bacterium]|nr:acetoacetate--CoA ligase [Lewinella sp.]MCB9279189.1 acetoacetate--CoA ligase [Lewinellaceae bacterium]
MTGEEIRMLWKPDQAFKSNSRLTHYANWLKGYPGLNFTRYADLWEWSVNHPADFWKSIWTYFDIKSHTPYQQVMTADPMPDTRWFTGASLNYAEHLTRHAAPDKTAIHFQSERHPLRSISWAEVLENVSKLATWMKANGVGKGDAVAAYLPNIPEATYAFMAACSIGAVWSSCSPDFGADSVLDRFRQIEPKVLFAADGYQYNGKPYDRMETIRKLAEEMPSLQQVALLPYLHEQADAGSVKKGVIWSEIQDKTASGPLEFEPVPFDHPIWVLYSSGTTGIPKAITHCHGGMLLEHFKYLAFHNDVQPGENFFWYSTTGWMMWNFVQASFLAGAAIVLYDGSPTFPNMEVLWKLAENAPVHHFGTSAPYLTACMKRGLIPGQAADLSALRSIGSTGAPLPPEVFDWCYSDIKEDLWLCSMSGGTDVCTAFVGGCPWEPVYKGEIQCRALGCALYAWNEEGEAVENEVGEMVIVKPMPSMPVFFWNDPGKARYHDSYFDMYPGVWRHGDWVTINERGGLVISGRSDATLNRHGIRIGTAEIYNTLNEIPRIKDSLIVNLELGGGRNYMPLFVQLEPDDRLDDALKNEIGALLKSRCSPRHVPDEIIPVPDIPFTISGKKLETPVKKILMGWPIGKAANPGAMRNPESLDFFVQFAQERKQDLK